MFISARLGRLALDQRHRIDARMVEQGALQLLVDHVVGRGVERERGQSAALDELLEIDQSEAGDRRQEDRHLGRHDRSHDQPENPPRQAKGEVAAAGGTDGLGRYGDVGGHCDERLPREYF